MELTHERNIPFLVDFIGVAAHVELDDSHRAMIASLLVMLPDGAGLKDFVDAASSQEDRHPLQLTKLAPIVEGLRQFCDKPSWTAGLFETTCDEIDMKAFVDGKFADGVGVLMLSQNAPDEVIVFAIRQAMSIGKPFSVIPAST